MKRTGFLLILILIISFTTNSAFAQLTGVGIKVGAGFANLQGSDVNQSMDSKTGFSGGAFVTYAFHEIIAIQPEVLYVFKGTKFTNTVLGYGTVEGEVILDYLEIPILIKATPPMTGNFKPNIFIGPSFGILTNAKLKIDTPPGYATRSIKEDMSSTDIGLSFGAGVEFELTQGAITFDGRYSLGLSSTFEQYIRYGPAAQSIFFTGEDKMKNSVISIMLGFSFM
ncbi:MAG: PorT family protein [Candidatus Zixiibacteriota bacterium]|nr:MAG: PorT family protein [candidate division Zixibacteria bacterium]